VVLVFNQRLLHKASQQSVHPTLGILARFQAFFYASAFFPVGRRPAARPSAGNANRWAFQYFDFHRKEQR